MEDPRIILFRSSVDAFTRTVDTKVSDDHTGNDRLRKYIVPQYNIRYK